MNEQLPTKETRRAASAAFIAAMLLVLVLVNVIINALAARYSWYLYTEEQYEHTIGDAANAVLGTAPEGETVRVIFCMAEDKMEADVVYALVLNTFRQLAERYDFIKIEFVNIYLHPEAVAPFRSRTTEAGETVESPISEQCVILVSGEDASKFRVELLQSFFILDGEQAITAYNGEEIAISAVAWVLSDSHPVAGFTMGHGENQSDLLAFYTTLVASGYDIMLLDLNEDIPQGVELIVIANPQWDFLRGSGVVSELDRLEAFLAGGGTLFVSLDPYAKAPLNGLRGFLAERGLAATQDVIHDSQNSITTDGYTLVTEFASSAFGTAIVDRLGKFSDARAIVREASVLELSSVGGYTATPILLSSPSSQSYKNGELTSDAGSFPVLAVAEAPLADGKSATVFLASSVYFLANDVMNSAIYANRDVVLASMEAASGNPAPVGCRVLSIDNSRLEDLTMGTARLYTLLVAVAVPLAVSAVGIYVIVRRKIR